jgi:hypothetical protein
MNFGMGLRMLHVKTYRIKKKNLYKSSDFEGQPASQPNFNIILLCTSRYCFSTLWINLDAAEHVLLSCVINTSSLNNIRGKQLTSWCCLKILVFDTFTSGKVSADNLPTMPSIRLQGLVELGRCDGKRMCDRSWRTDLHWMRHKIPRKIAAVSQYLRYVDRCLPENGCYLLFCIVLFLTSPASILPVGNRTQAWRPWFTVSLVFRHNPRAVAFWRESYTQQPLECNHLTDWSTHFSVWFSSCLSSFFFHPSIPTLFVFIMPLLYLYSCTFMSCLLGSSVCP